ncbi:MAG TPA: CsgG/HfaB family protein [Vicinamibacterales bacterium]|nr:CsgG/HfaB family protein [Vicinamibacterales bacterium]
MKRLVCVVACLAVLLVVRPAAAQRSAAGSGTRKIRVAVMDFDYATVRGSTAAIFGTDTDVGRGISDLLITQLVNDGTYSVIERGALNTVLAEQQFSNSDRADPTSAARLGRLLGVDAIIVGSITQFGNDTKTTGLGGVGARLSGGALGGANFKSTRAVVEVNARIVDIDTAEILAVAAGHGESKRTSTSLLGGGGSFRGFGAAGVNFGSSDFQNTIIGEAVKHAVDQLGAGVVSGQGRLHARAVQVTGLVADVDGSSLVLNVGRRAGLKVGDRLAVERAGREIKDPATGRVIRRVTTAVGVVRITEVDDESSLATVVSGGAFKVGDGVKTEP